MLSCMYYEWFYKILRVTDIGLIYLQRLTTHLISFFGLSFETRKNPPKIRVFFHEKTLLTFTCKWSPTTPPKLFYTISNYPVTSWIECGFLFRDVLRKYKNNHPGGSVSQSDFSNMTHQGGSFLKVYLPPLHNQPPYQRSVHTHRQCPIPSMVLVYISLHLPYKNQLFM